MTDQYVSRPRQRFCRRLADQGAATQDADGVSSGDARLTRFLGHAPDSATAEELSAFQLI